MFKYVNISVKPEEDLEFEKKNTAFINFDF